MVTFNSDKEIVDEIKSQLSINGGYCPCQLDKTPDTKCMCRQFREQVKNKIPGECHCGLYVFIED